MQYRTISTEDNTCSYRVTGKGRTVLFLHGFGEDGDIWASQAGHLANRYRLIIPDLPGSGRSALANVSSIEGMAEIIRQIIEKETVDAKNEQNNRVVIFGHSMGGYIALALAEKYPQQVAAFGLIHSSAYADNPEKITVRKKSIAFIEKNGAAEFLQLTLPGLFNSDGDPAQNARLLAPLLEKAGKFSKQALNSYYQAMIDRPDRIQVLKNFAGPVLFIIGEKDSAVPFNQSLQQCYLPMQSHISILRQSGHMGMLEEPQKLNRSLDLFLATIWPD